MNLSNVKWESTSGSPPLVDGDIDLWRADLARDQVSIGPLFGSLSDDEKIRADRFHFARDRERFVVGRATLRKIISSYLGIRPEIIVFSYNRFGKPSLAAGDGRLRFNVSHSRETGLIAVTKDRAVGVDIEFADRNFDVMSVAKGAFSEAEVSRLRSLPAGLRTAAFYEGWTRKEACLKAMGDGLSSSPDQLSAVSAVIRRSEASFESVVDGKATEWSLMSLGIADDYKAALAVEGRIRSVRYWHLPDDAGSLQRREVGSPSAEVPRVLLRT